MLDFSVAIASLGAFLIGLGAIAIVRRVALACGFLDNPDSWRKLHLTPIALGGGIAVWLATWAGWSAVILFRSFGAIQLEQDTFWFFGALLAATFLILSLGIVDDRISIRGRHKLAGQFMAALILVRFGLQIDAWSCFGFEWKLGLFAYPVTVLWILVVVNAFNLIDGMDGFCGSLGLITSLAIGFAAYRSGRIEDAMLALTLAGALAAFLRYNLPPAKIYLGDAGSMTIGMMISALSVRSCTNGPGTAVSVLPVVALLTLPMLDIVTAVSRRLLKSRSIFTADRGHIHHCLRGRLGSTAASLIVAALLTTVGAIGATLATTYRMGDTPACLVIALSVGALACTNTFGTAESRLLLFRIKVALAPLMARKTVSGRVNHQECHLHGNRDWASVWKTLVREGETSGVWRIDLAIDITATGDVYQGHWSSPAAIDDEPHWSVIHTLHAGNMTAGVIRVSGNVDRSGYSYLEKVERLVRVVESQLVTADKSVSPADASSFTNVNLSVNSALT